jgi:predicted DsbA family dithiol-disulfide isomerase
MGVSADSVIEVFADIWCPFTHVGLRAVDEQRVLAGRPDVAIRVRAWPLELVNGTPLDPATTAAHVEHLREQVAPTMFTDFRVDQFPTSTLEALALVERAYRTDIRLGERASFDLRDALFEHGRDISDQRVLTDIAERLGIDLPDEVDRGAVRADWRQGQDRGVRGSPHFFCGETSSFCPSLQITKDPEHGVSIQRDASRLTAFLEKCLMPSVG